MARRSDLIARTMAVALVAASAPALAQLQRDAASVLGAWRFDTTRYDGADGHSCKMSGTMTIVRGARANAFACAFVAVEDCIWGKWSAEQRCSATRNGDKLEITSTIMRLTPTNISYAPDNWSLTIRSSALMVGELRSADVATVQFTRGPAYTS